MKMNPVEMDYQRFLGEKKTFFGSDVE